MFFVSSLVKQTPIYPFVGEDASSILYSSFRITFKKALGNRSLASKEQLSSNLLFLKKCIYKTRKIC